ncbi:MAG: M1 family peptidase [Sphingobacteriales bacterium]|nr:MAG: M1 family peptidase [Sphingobacteriales bacterium]
MVTRKNIFLIAFLIWYLPFANTIFAYGRQDTLRGSNGAGRQWWDVLLYDLDVKFDTTQRSISGTNTITFTISKAAGDSMQIDLQEPMVLDEVKFEGQNLTITKEGNVWWVIYPFNQLRVGKTQQITIRYHGKPKPAANAPWDGGFIWTKDHNGKLWASVACQGLGASVWWPCKDLQSDEPDHGMTMRYTVPSNLQCIANGRLIAKTEQGANTQWSWQVREPINTYNATFYIGDYVGWKDTVKGEKGALVLDHYVIRGNEEKARKQFAVVKDMITCFEYWMGPYPFYTDGYKLVEAPFLGMEHQSAIAYGNEYKMGYRGMDRSGTGVGKLFDYIIIHESGHEWFGNNITATDIADNWIQEGFTTYSETLFSQCMFGREKAFQFMRGEWKNIRNDRPIIGNYGVNDAGSGDKYDKGAAIVHMLRIMLNNDATFRDLLRGLNKSYYHKTVSTAELERDIINFTKLPLRPFFDQYLRTTMIPQFEWYVKDDQLFYRFTSVVPGFSLPLEIKKRKKQAKITVTGDWQSVAWKKGGYNIDISPDFLIHMKE